MITPAPPRSRKGNRVTAVRWSRHLRDLGHTVHIDEEYTGRDCDILVALHAKRSFASAKRFKDAHPDLPLIVALTGTDLYKDILTDTGAQQSLEMADRLIVLQAMGTSELPKRHRAKTRVIVQSIEAPAGNYKPRKNSFNVCVIGHMREVKDPFRAAEASRLLARSSKIEVMQIGGALSKDMEVRALKEAKSNPRYSWVGEVPRWKVLRLLSKSRLHVLSSEMEGGANALCEAIACSVPTLASRISGSIGLLGEDYPGYFELKDTKGLASMLERAENDPGFYKELKTWTRRIKRIVSPANETRCWKMLVKELAV